jgi:HK97 family phage major capsid protein
MARHVTAAQKHQLMTRLLATQAGRQKIAATIQEPLRKLRDYQAIGRKAFFVDELPDGTLPIYDMDINTPAYVVAEEGDSVVTLVKSTRMMIPLFELASYPKVPFTQVKERRFDIVRRIKQKARDELFRKEDRIIFNALTTSAAANVNNVTITVTTANFNMDLLADAFAQIERWGLRVDKVFMNAIRYPVIRKAGRDFVDFETQRELLRTGYMGSLWGAAIYQSPECPGNTVFLVTEPEYLGVIPVRIDLTVIPADDPVNRAFGWSIFEQLGVGIHNADHGLQAIVLSDATQAAVTDTTYPTPA